MYIFSRSIEIPRPDLNRSIEALISGTWGQDVFGGRQERVRRAAFYESYAKLCLSEAFPGGLPRTNPPLTADLIKAVADKIYYFRARDEERFSVILLETRWMLEGYLEIPASTNLEPWQWDSRIIEFNPNAPDYYEEDDYDLIYGEEIFEDDEIEAQWGSAWKRALAIEEFKEAYAQAKSQTAEIADTRAAAKSQGYTAKRKSYHKQDYYCEDDF